MARWQVGTSFERPFKTRSIVLAERLKSKLNPYPKPCVPINFAALRKVSSVSRAETSVLAVKIDTLFWGFLTFSKQGAEHAFDLDVDHWTCHWRTCQTHHAWP